MKTKSPEELKDTDHVRLPVERTKENRAWQFRIMRESNYIRQ